MKVTKDGSIGPEAWHTVAYSMPPQSEPRSGEMTTGAVDKGAAGHPDSPLTSGGSGHSSSHISSAIPAVFVILVIVLGSLLGWYIVRRLRLSGRRILSFLIASEQKPELSEVVISETTLRYTTWSTLSPISVDFGSSEERHRWEREHAHRSSRGPTSSIAKHPKPRSSPKRGHGTLTYTARKVGESEIEHRGVRVAVFIAMPAPRAEQLEGVPYWHAERKIMSMQSTELCLGTVQTFSV